MIEPIHRTTLYLKLYLVSTLNRRGRHFFRDKQLNDYLFKSSVIINRLFLIEYTQIHFTVKMK